MQYFARSGALVGFPELVRKHGQNPNSLLREAGLSLAILHNTDLYIPYASLAKVLVLAAERCRLPTFGACLGHRQGLEALGALGSLLCMQASLPDALRMMQRNLDFHARGVQVDVDAQAGSVDIRLRFAFAGQVDCSQLTTLSMALLVQGLSQLHGQGLGPTEVRLAIPDDGHGDDYKAILGPEVQLNSGENRVSFTDTLLTLPLNPSPDMRERLSQQWRGSWEQSDSPNLTHQIERAMAALLPTGECNLDTVARMVELHPRSLQTRLKDERCSFGELLKNTRLKLAYQYLRNSDIDLTNLALNLGFSELAPFSRAFRIWTGQSPRQWRQSENEFRKIDS